VTVTGDINAISKPLNNSVTGDIGVGVTLYCRPYLDIKLSIIVRSLTAHTEAEDTGKRDYYILCVFALDCRLAGC